MEKVVLVTGASSGIGKELVREFRKKKYLVIATGRTEQAQPEYIAGDITNKETRDKLKVAVEKCGKLDILVNNAGISYIQPFVKNTPEDLDLILDTNVKAPILLTQLLYPYLKKSQGTIVFINSAAGRQGYPKHTLYSMSKFAINGYSQSLRLEAKNDGVRVMSIYPGGVRTNLYDRVLEKPDTSLYMDPAKLAQLVVHAATTNGLSPDEIVISRLTK